MQRQQQNTIKSISSMNGLHRMSASILTQHDEQIHPLSLNRRNTKTHESVVVHSSLRRNDSSEMASSRHQRNVFFDSSMIDDVDMQSSNDAIHYSSEGPSSTRNKTTTNTTMTQRTSLLHQVSLLGSSASDLNYARSSDQMLNNMHANVPFTSASQNVSSTHSSSSDMSTEKKDESDTARDLSDARRLSQLLKESHMLGVTRKTRSAGQELMFMKHKNEPPMSHHNGANTTNSLRSIRFRSFNNATSDMSMQANSSFKFASSTLQQPKRNMFLDMLNQPTPSLETSKKTPVNPYFSPPQGQIQQPISSVSEMSLNGMNLSKSSPPRPILRQQGSFRKRHSSGNMKRTATFSLRRNIRVHDTMESTNANINGGMALDRHLVKRRRL